MVILVLLAKKSNKNNFYNKILFKEILNLKKYLLLHDSKSFRKYNLRGFEY